MLIRLTRQFLLIILAILLLNACSFGQPVPTATETELVRTPTAGLNSTESAEPTAPTRPPTLSPEVVTEMEQLEDQVVSLRGLPLLEPVERRLLSVTELETRIQADLLENYSPEEAADDARLLAMFGMLPAGFDLWAFYSELYTEQIAGYYDDEEGALFVVAGADFEGPQRLTYVHEFTHALQDQHFDLRDNLAYTEESCQLQSDRCAAVQAMIEGDASLLEEQWLRTYASQEDFDELVSFYDSFQSPSFDQAPAALKRSFIFPYQQGLEFISWHFQRDGWAAIDSLYTEPPTSTEMILHPLRYAQDFPVELELSAPQASTLGSGWRLLDQGTLGEFDFRLLLAAALEEEAATEAAAGWGGDRYAAYYHDDLDQGAWFIIHQWDTIRDAQDTYLTWRDYGETRFGPRIPDGRAYNWESESGHARLELASNQTLWLVAPDDETLSALRDQITFPADS